MKSYLAKTGEIEPKWYVIDAEGEVLGRLAVKIANILRGRHRPTYTPHTDTGDFVVVLNAAKVAVTGRKEEQKKYMFYSGYFGNEKYIGLKEFRNRKPEFIIENAVKGMLPRNRLARAQMKKLKIYAGTEHPHEAQNPVPYEG
ncbi:50S ribosomal protein L13 [Puniceicoccales bacterium CK1056]|uniref:Large ribosomal subunit protein uL13 n=1 Tax=Oceanipulchritudo coccoides TaxID=2706888 RepID=A0A6B2M0U6_9BACT|nr:50S ribosomal protein L13 [Oceanipulchritudo coccoides]NDV62591.1 50S ribosomal protein L13 [Oceanipulchritudo coccoides]